MNWGWLRVSWSGRRDSRTRFARAQSLGASACVRIPKNVPLARFLNGIPPHRFDSLYLDSGAFAQRKLSFAENFLERATGIEPASGAWKAPVLPLNYARVVGTTGFEPATSCSQSKRATKLRHVPYCGSSHYSKLCEIWARKLANLVKLQGFMRL